MSLTAALLVLAQIASVGAGNEGTASQASTARPAPVATATARAQIVRPVAVRFNRETQQVEVESRLTGKPQRGSDEAGTVWIEFS